MIASVAVAAAVYAIDKPYSYYVPESCMVKPGMRVIVPFGKGNRRSEAIVLSVEQELQDGLKPILQVMDEESVISENFIRMAAFLRERYFCTFYDAIKVMLPAGLWFDTAEVFSLTEQAPEKMISLQNPDAAAVVRLLQDHGGIMSHGDLKKQWEDLETLSDAIGLLQRKKIIQSNLDYSRKVRDKTERIAELSVLPEEAMSYAAQKKKSAPIQAEVLKLLCAIGSGSVKEICYLTGATGQTISRMEKLGLLSLSVREVFRTPLPVCVDAAPPFSLNEDQTVAFEALRKQLWSEKPGVSLLRGVTGSGKTAVYLELIRDALSRGCGAVLLVPEIALTPQLIELLMSQFGQEVAVLHSALRVTERYDEWKRIRQGSARVVIGTRSAVFAPVQNLGLLILDEEQEHSYKSDQSPRYHAREVAIYRGAKEQALVVLGSATPSVETMHLAKTGVYHSVSLPKRYNQKQLP